MNEPTCSMTQNTTDQAITNIRVRVPNIFNEKVSQLLVCQFVCDFIIPSTLCIDRWATSSSSIYQVSILIPLDSSSMYIARAPPLPSLGGTMRQHRRIAEKLIIIQLSRTYFIGVKTLTKSTNDTSEYPCSFREAKCHVRIFLKLLWSSFTEVWLDIPYYLRQTSTITTIITDEYVLILHE